MIAVFLTMGVILAIAIAPDAFVVRMVHLPVVLRSDPHVSWHQPRWGLVLPKISFMH